MESIIKLASKSGIILSAIFLIASVSKADPNNKYFKCEKVPYFQKGLVVKLSKGFDGNISVEKFHEIGQSSEFNPRTSVVPTPLNSQNRLTNPPLWTQKDNILNLMVNVQLLDNFGNYVKLSFEFKYNKVTDTFYSVKVKQNGEADSSAKCANLTQSEINNLTAVGYIN